MFPPLKVYVTQDDIRYILFEKDEVISNEIREKGVWNPNILEVADKILKKSEEGRIIDIGAGIGTFSIPLAVKNYGKFLFECVEPMYPMNLQLCANILLNSLDCINVRNFVASNYNEDTSGPMIELERSTNHGSLSLLKEVNEARGIAESEETFLYEYKAIDSLMFGNDVRLVKISVSGMELSVLEGMSNTLEISAYPPVIFECWDRDWNKENRESVLDFFKSRGYEHYLMIGDHVITFHTLAQYNYFIDDTIISLENSEMIGEQKVSEILHNTNDLIELGAGNGSRPGDIKEE